MFTEHATAAQQTVSPMIQNQTTNTFEAGAIVIGVILAVMVALTAAILVASR